MNTSPVEVSIIIVTYHSADVIRSCLDSIEADGTIQGEIFVVDNASTDGTAEIARKEYPSVHLIANTKNRGFSAANNQAIPLCRGRYLFFLNPDAKLGKNCLEEAVRYMDENPCVGLAGTKIVHPGGSLQETVSRRYPGEKYSTDEMAGLKGSIACVMGASMIARAQIVRAVGGFDEDYFLYGEDQELCLRIRQLGHEIGYIEQTVVTHIGGHSENASLPAAVWKRKTLAEYVFYHKHYRPDTIIKITREHRVKAWWRIFTINLFLPFTLDRARAQDKLVKYRSILQALKEQA